MGKVLNQQYIVDMYEQYLLDMDEEPLGIEYPPSGYDNDPQARYDNSELLPSQQNK